MKISNFFNGLSKRYSFNLLAYMGILLILEYLCYPILEIIVESIYKGMLIIRGELEFIFMSFILISNFFSSLLILKIAFVIKWFILEQNNSEFRIKSKFVNNKFYKIFCILPFLFSIVILSCSIYLILFVCHGNEIADNLTKYYYFSIPWIILPYFLLTKSKKSIKSDIIFYILFYPLAFTFIFIVLMPLVIY